HAPVDRVEEDLDGIAGQRPDDARPPGRSRIVHDHDLSASSPGVPWTHGERPRNGDERPLTSLHVRSSATVSRLLRGCRATLVPHTGAVVPRSRHPQVRSWAWSNTDRPRVLVANSHPHDAVSVVLVVTGEPAAFCLPR